MFLMLRPQCLLPAYLCISWAKTIRGQVNRNSGEWENNSLPDKATFLAYLSGWWWDNTARGKQGQISPRSEKKKDKIQRQGNLGQMRETRSLFLQQRLLYTEARQGQKALGENRDSLFQQRRHLLANSCWAPKDSTSAQRTLEQGKTKNKGTNESMFYCLMRTAHALLWIKADWSLWSFYICRSPPQKGPSEVNHKPKRPTGPHHGQRRGTETQPWPGQQQQSPKPMEEKQHDTLALAGLLVSENSVFLPFSDKMMAVNCMHPHG